MRRGVNETWWTEATNAPARAGGRGKAYLGLLREAFVCALPLILLRLRLVEQRRQTLQLVGEFDGPLLSLLGASWWRDGKHVVRREKWGEEVSTHAEWGVGSTRLKRLKCNSSFTLNRLSKTPHTQKLICGPQHAPALAASCRGRKAARHSRRACASPR